MKSRAEKVDYRLGELLVDLGVTSPGQVDRGLQVSRYTSLPLGKTLVMLDLVPDRVIKGVVEAQSMLRDRLLELKQAKEAINIVQRKEWTFADALISLGVDASATRGTRLGELLKDAGKINEEQLDLALKISDHSGLPLGHVMVLLNRITEDKVRMTLAMQRELRANNLERKDVIKRLKVDEDADTTATGLPAAAPGPNVTLSQSGVQAVLRSDDRAKPPAIETYDFEPAKSDLESAAETKRIRLGELLVAADIIEATTVDNAIRFSDAHNQMLGEVLIGCGLISEDILTAALRLQSLLWSNRITLDRAVSILKEARIVADSSRTFAEVVAAESCTGSSAEQPISFFEFLKLTGYLSKEKLIETTERIMDEPRLLAIAMKHAKRVREMNGDYVREAIELALQDGPTLRFLINEIEPKNRSLVDSALVFHQLVQEGKLTLCQALVNFSIKSHGIETEIIPAKASF